MTNKLSLACLFQKPVLPLATLATAATGNEIKGLGCSHSELATGNTGNKPPDLLPVLPLQNSYWLQENTNKNNAVASVASVAGKKTHSETETAATAVGAIKIVGQGECQPMWHCCSRCSRHFNAGDRVTRSDIVPSPSNMFTAPTKAWAHVGCASAPSPMSIEERAALAVEPVDDEGELWLRGEFDE